MRRIAHLSDLHFGRHDDRVVAGLLSALTTLSPDVVVISGDFTQRARRRQFAAARDFLAGLRAAGLPVVAVPGNHDIPLYDVLRRFLRPLARFRRYIEPAEYPFVADEEIAVLGINTARSLTIADGRVSHDQMACIEQIFARAAPGARRMLVTHHPLVSLPGGPEGRALRAAGRSGSAIEAAVRANVHLLLAGHHHQPFHGSGATFFAAGHSLLVVQAGTTTSTRLRAHANSFNLIETNGDALRIAVHAWDADGFEAASLEAYRCVDGRWQES
ncbi:metallophosphoesterase family protein [Sphingoaurantiacus capsulatus]|uniref:Metallophosphoesterase family protein n=1 Tax=Sphingoaurantiacus capsulatus TaxID=1771310 RepID=A0ABV7X9L1_9SPHN